ncbi:unnamed protein product, partial [Linum tenue]
LPSFPESVSNSYQKKIRTFLFSSADVSSSFDFNLLLAPLSLSNSRVVTMATTSRWIRPEVFPLFATIGVAVGICGMQLVRNITGNPEVRVTKENRAAGILDNHEEGEKYKEHALRKFVRTKRPEVMPGINGFFSDPR